MLNLCEENCDLERDLFNVSVVICAYNAENRLPEVLEALSRQITTPGLAWEILVVDNNSTDGTASAAEKYSQSFGSEVLFRVVHEPLQGLIYARRCGWIESRGSVISYLDDDNIVATDWVQSVWNFFLNHPRAGMVGPRIYPLMDFTPPAYFHYVKQSLAIRDLGDELLNTTHSVHGHPPGAGMSCPRQVLKPIFIRHDFSAVGRQGTQLTSGEDSMIALAIRRAGWEWWYEPKMILWHRLPESRMEIPYLRRLFRGMGMSSASVAEESIGRPLPLSENYRYIYKYVLRYMFYSLVALVHPREPYRIYAKLLREMFRGGFEAHMHYAVNR